MVREKIIITNSIKDHLIHHVSSLYSPKKMMDTLTPLFEGSNINQRMTLRSPEISVEECEKAELRNHSLLLLKSESNQGADRSHW